MSPGIFQKDICRKLKISEGAVRKWKKRYKAEVEDDIEEIDVATILKEEEIDIERMLKEADRYKVEDAEASSEETIDKIFSKDRRRKEYKASEK